MTLFSLALASAVLQGVAGGWNEGPPLPHPVANNTVAVTMVRGEPIAFSFMGLDSTRAWDGVTSAAFSWRVAIVYLDGVRVSVASITDLLSGR